jgi:hypothetical protein
MSIIMIKNLYTFLCKFIMSQIEILYYKDNEHDFIIIIL